MVEVLACGRSFSTGVTNWAWVDYFGQKFAVAKAVEAAYCGRRHNPDAVYRLICDKCLVRAGLSW